jgi:hypothetical protein
MAAAINRGRHPGTDHFRRLSGATALSLMATLVVVAIVDSGFATAGQRDARGKIAPQASVQRAGRPSTAASSRDDATGPIPTSVLEKIPWRAIGTDERPGDIVNFLIVGSESDMILVFRAAGWTAVERAKAGAAPSPEPPASLSEEEYVAMPLRGEFLFGKTQDYGFAQEALVTVLQARREVRIWKAPFTVTRQALWIGAASHEGPWWDNTAGAVNYGADTNVDDEREFLETSLLATGLAERLGYISSRGEPEKTGATASEGLRTDGRVVVIRLIHL